MKSYISKTAIFLLVLFCGTHVNAQLIDNANGKVFTNRPYFNEKLIGEKKIRSISGSEIHYKLGDKPRETEYFKSYFFNRKGQLIKQIESVELTKEADTLVTFYDYDEQGNITAIRQRDAFGNYAYFYKYDEKGRVINEEFRRELSSFPIKSPDFILGERFIVSSEKSTYEDFENMQKRTYYTTSNQPYKSVLTRFNNKGLAIEEVVNMNRMHGSKTTQFFYNQRNQVDSIAIHSNISGSQSKTFVYEYDKYGNLVKKEEFKNGEYIMQYQVLYDEESILIDDVLVQHISMDFIKVLELRRYAYFDKYN
ncbi:hypothetical protein [Brumimicrobium oceani]|uniref:Sugar-binding protein n=1 Tax=Brumimicrobium oceani TaxID=2100725 RepID=A0A2U2XDH5_9FLAO|nr:hypothetical protein [Brumimicrobium oceani]PWH85859.1 hypothetical protein DIT68_07130 [Brumimicrobium oceani]